jgi:hypothetical protein
LATATEDVLHVHGGHASSEVTDQLHPLLLPGMVREPRLHPTEVLAGAQLHGGEGNTGSLPDSHHHRSFEVLHHDDLLEASHLCLIAGSRQLLLQCWQQDDMKVTSCKHQPRHKTEEILTHDAGLGIGSHC